MLKTIRDGERVAVWHRNGCVDLVDGPRRVWIIGRVVTPLAQHRAAVNEYLAVDFRDGRREHIPGPVALWFDPLRHQAVEVRSAIPVNANEAIIVYANRAGENERGEVQRRVVRGPCQFVPEPDEWLHQFVWHGSVKGGRKAPGALRFNRLRVIPDQMYHDVEDVRTADDALVTVMLMIFFELADIETMLDQTHDPVADIINAVSADVVAFAGRRLFEDFKRDGDALNDLAEYPNLTQRAERIGYKISKVVYRGYTADAKLQAMHDHAIQTRTGLKLEAETERQAQELADLKQTRELERQARDRDNETACKEHALALARREHEAALRNDRERAEQEVALQRDADTARLASLEAENRARGAFFGQLKVMDVDLTRYLVAQYQNPDRIIRIDGAPTAAVHLENA